MKSTRLATDLVGARVHLVTDEEARIEAKRQGIEEPLLSAITAEKWLPVLKDMTARHGSHGTIRQVHVEDGRSVYTIAFPSGELVELSPMLWRLDNP
jgi:hypothetical protein